MNGARLQSRGWVDRLGALAQAHVFAIAALGSVALSALLLLNDTVRYLLVLPHDWAMFTEVPDRLADGRLYDLGRGYYWVWSPIAAWIMAYVIVPLGYSFWFGLHLAMLPLLRNWKLIAVTLVAVPFWIDVVIGNSVIFVFTAGVAALRGSKLGALAYLALFLLLPRPIQVPLAAWILWNRPDFRIPFIIMVAITLCATLWSGYAEEWIAVVLPFAAGSYDNPANFGPTNLFGATWFVIGAPLAMWLTARGCTGLAGLALTPYLLPQYLLLLLWDIRFEGSRGFGQAARGRGADVAQG